MESLVELNTNEGSIGFQTKKLSGFLDSIIIDAETKIEIIIESELGYKIFHKKDCYGIQYFPIRVRPVDEKAWGSNFQLVEYNLNEKLNITTYGPRNKKVSIRIRLK